MFPPKLSVSLAMLNRQSFIRKWYFLPACGSLFVLIIVLMALWLSATTVRSANAIIELDARAIRFELAEPVVSIEETEAAFLASASGGITLLGRELPTNTTYTNLDGKGFKLSANSTIALSGDSSAVELTFLESTNVTSTALNTSPPSSVILIARSTKASGLAGLESVVLGRRETFILQQEVAEAEVDEFVYLTEQETGNNPQKKYFLERRKSERGAVDLEFQPFAIKSIDLSRSTSNLLIDPAVETRTGNLRKRLSTINFGEIHWQDYDKSFALYEHDPISITIKDGLVTDVQVTSSGISITVLAKVLSLDRASFPFGTERSELAIESLLPSRLDGLFSFQLFSIFVSSSIFVIALLQLFELRLVASKMKGDRHAAAESLAEQPASEEAADQEEMLESEVALDTVGQSDEVGLIQEVDVETTRADE